MPTATKLHRQAWLMCWQRGPAKQQYLIFILRPYSTFEPQPGERLLCSRFLKIAILYHRSCRQDRWSWSIFTQYQQHKEKKHLGTSLLTSEAAASGAEVDYCPGSEEASWSPVYKCSWLSPRATAWLKGRSSAAQSPPKTNT